MSARGFFSLRLLFALQETGEEGDEEGGGLAGAGLGLAGHVLAGQGEGEGLLLDGGAVGKSGIGDALQHRIEQGKFGEFHVSFFLFYVISTR